MFDLSMMVTQSARQYPEKTALAAGEEEWTYSQLDHAIATMAHRLIDYGFRPGESVGLQLKNTSAFVISYYAVLRAGLTAVPFNPLAVEREVEHILTVGRCRAAVVSDATASTVLAAAESREDFLLILDSDPDRGSVQSSDDSSSMQFLRMEDSRVIPFAELLEENGTDLDPSMVPVTRHATDDAVVIFTSGTTGHPKGAVLSHFNLWMSCAALTFRSNPTADEVALGCLPLFHVFGMSGTLNVAMAWGMTLVLAPKSDPETLLELVEKYRVTRFSAVPTMLSDLIRAGAHGRDLSSVRRVTSGGSTLRRELVAQFEEMFPEAALLEGYGASETTSSVCVNQNREERKIGSVGTPSWGTRMRVTDMDGAVLERGDAFVGELQISGPTIFSGYIGDERATREAFDGGWFRTGDMARIDEDGYVYIVDRIKNLIIRGGYNVYPSEVEQVLEQHPGIAEVVVVGLTDERVGQEIAAVVVPREGVEVNEEEIKAYAREQLSAYKCPRIVKISHYLPRSSTGKVLRRRVVSVLS